MIIILSNRIYSILWFVQCRNFGSLFLLFIFFGLLACNQKTSEESCPNSYGSAGEICVLYVPSLNDSIEDFKPDENFTGVDLHLKPLDSNLIRYELDVSETNSNHFEPLNILAWTTFQGFHETNASLGNKFSESPIIWILGKGNEKNLKETIETSSNHKSLKINGIDIILAKNVWAKPQTVIYINCEGMNGTNFKTHLKALMQLSVNSELTDTIHTPTGSIHSPYLEQNTYSDSLETALHDKYNFRPCLSAEMKLVMANNDFIWLRNENSNYHCNLMINIYPINDSFLGTAAQLKKWSIAMRNNFTKKYLKTAEGTWVSISESGRFPLRWSNQFETEIWLSGWYTELNTSRRGPFIRRILRDDKNHRMIAVDGFVFAPNQPRIRLMRELQIMISAFNYQNQNR